MEGLAVIKGKVYSLSPLQQAEIVAYEYDFFDLDVDGDDNGLGGVKITASTVNGASVSAKGKTEAEAVRKLIERMTGK